MVFARPEEKGWGREVRKTQNGKTGEMNGAGKRRQIVGEGGWQAQKRELTWMSGQRPVRTEACRMELRVVPTYSVSPRPSATVRTGPKHSGTWAGKSREGRQMSVGPTRMGLGMTCWGEEDPALGALVE